MTTQSILFSFFIVASIHFLAVVSPGPDFAIIVKTALSQSRRESIITAFGIACGILIHITYCLLGLAIVITHSVFLFSIIKYMGAAYMIYIGIQCLLAKKTSTSIQTTAPKSHRINSWKAFRTGFICNVLNPKVTLFFLGLFTLVVNPATPMWVQILYGVEMFLATFAWFSFLSIMITHKNVKNKMSSIQYYLTKLMGILLLIFGFEIAFIQIS